MFTWHTHDAGRMAAAFAMGLVSATALQAQRTPPTQAVAAKTVAAKTVAAKTVASSAAKPTSRAVTYTRDVAPILQQKCQQCHQPGSIAPMSLLTYEDAKKYSRRIRTKVSERLMPPWHIDRTVGIQQFKNDGSLSDAQVQTIVDWVDAGAPLGDTKDMPPAMTFPDPNRWQLAETLGGSMLLTKGELHRLVPLVSVNSIPKEVNEKLDLLLDLFSAAATDEAVDVSACK